QRGQIFIDGVDISTFDKQQLRASCGYIQQDVFLFSGSVLDNITLWNDNTDLHKFLNHSIFDKSHFAKSLKSRLSDNLVESGTNLSKGERQILSFLRALSHDPNLWILDEATSSMDTDSEELLQVALQQFSENKTVISIAHRLSTIENCDLILVLSRGELKESGTHEELIAKRGLYHALHQLSEVHEWDKNIHSPSFKTSCVGVCPIW